MPHDHRPGDLQHPRALVFKGALFAIGALIAGVTLVLHRPAWDTAALVLILAWCAARFYYFCFYVVERYADPSHRYAGIFDALRHATRIARRNG